MCSIYLGFGHRISWGDGSLKPAHHKITFKEAIHIVSTGIFIKLSTPRWAYLTKSLRKVDLAFKELEVCYLP